MKMGTRPGSMPAREGCERNGLRNDDVEVQKSYLKLGVESKLADAQDLVVLRTSGTHPGGPPPTTHTPPHLHTLMSLYRALRGCSYGSRGFLEDR